jgi:DNA replication and repair protein RecF
VHSNRYEAAMRARNRLLAEGRMADPEWLGALEAQMAEHGAAIDAARRDTVTALAARLADAPEGPFARAGLALEGWSDAAGTLAVDLAAGRGRDAAAGRARAGPHRSDLAVTHLGKAQSAALCSTGEQKALLLGLILAHADLVAERTGRPPLLLLDEVAAHLDPVRRAALFERLAGKGQVWMTGTEPALFEGLPTTVFRLKIGA